MADQLSPKSQQMLDRAFLQTPLKEKPQQKLETMHERAMGFAGQMMRLGVESPEQEKGLQKVREALFWFQESIRKYEF